MYPENHIIESLRNIRSTFELRLNRYGAIKKHGYIDANGKVIQPEYEPRWELWDTDPDGKRYKVLTVQHTDGTFRVPDEKLVEHVRRMNPARYSSYSEWLRVLIEEPEFMREIGTEKDSNDLIDAASKWAQWIATPKSGSHLSYRGQRLLS